MAVVSVAFDGTRLSEAESETDGGTWDEFGTSKSPTQETAIVYQEGTSSAAISQKVSASTNGIDFDSTSSYDFSTGPKNVLALVNVTETLSIDTTVHGGTQYVIGSDGSNYWSFYIHGSKKSYPPLGGWQILAIDPNETAYRAATTGSPAIASIDYFGWQADMTGTAKAENVIHDTLSYLTTGDGLTLTRGDSTDDDGVFQDFADYDAGTAANRWGVVVQVPPDIGPLSVTGWLNIGDSTGTNATVFNDSGAVVFWTESLTAEGFNGLLLYQQNASDDIDIADCFLKGQGRGFAKDLFHTTNDIDGTNDVITLDATKNWQDLDYVVYSKEGGSAGTGLTDTSSYWIAWDATNSGWAVYSSRDNAATDTSRVNLTSTGTENHSFLKDPDTRPDLTVNGTTGLGVDITGCTIDNFRNITLTSKATLDNCKITNCEQITQAAGTISNCTISTATTDDGEAFIVSNGSTNLISNCDFTFSDGHAIEITSGSAYTLTGLNFTGYGSTGSNDAAIYNNTGGALTLTISGASAPTYRNGSGASTTIVTSPVTTLVHVGDQDGNDLQNARVYLKAADGTGPLPFEDSVTITRSGTTATVSHTSHGMNSNEFVKIQGITDKTEDNNGAHQITVTGTNSYTYTTTDSGSTSYTGTITSTGVLLHGNTDVNGDISITRAVATDQPVDGFVRKSSASPRFKTFDLGGNTIDSANGVTINVRLVSDE